jgi:hypothetical protein
MNGFMLQLKRWFILTCVVPVCSTFARRDDAVIDRSLFQQAREIKATIDPKLGTELTLLSQASDMSTNTASDEPSTPDVLVVDIAFSTPLNNDEAASILSSISGLEVINCHDLLCSVQLPISGLSALAQLDAVQFARLANALSDHGLDTQ